jgi:hypothetical protein
MTGILNKNCMKTKILLLLLIITTKLLVGQTATPAYYSFIKKADSLYKVKDYKNSALAYSSAFKTFGWKGHVFDRYNAARSWALSNTPDSAFDCLDRIVKKRYFTNYDSLTKEKDFTVLHPDKRWQKLLDVMKLYGEYKVPDGWLIAGTVEDRDKYVIGIEKGSGQDGKNAATIKSTETNIKGFGNLMQNFLPDKYIGKRVRMSGYMKSKDVVEWASFWFRVDQSGSNTSLAFDNMIDGKEKRPIKGTTDWKKYEIVLDVPEKSSNIAFGIMLGGTGQIWFDNLKFEIVDKSVPTTGKEPKTGPTNLNFEE